MAQDKYSLEAINERLRLSNMGVTIRQKGNRLYLRATLPPKPRSSKTRAHQQDVTLKLYANPAGLQRAEAEARKVGALLACKEFSWSLYGQPESKSETVTIGRWVERFKTHYMQTHTLEERTWHRHWWEVYKRLPLDEVLSASVILAAVLKTEADTRHRKQTCQKLQKLADFAGLEIDLASYAGSYSSAKAKPRELPDDAVIMEWRDRIPYAPWRWVYGMLAAYGLRPHEAFFCEFVEDDSNRVLQVLEGKTGPRKVYPLYVEWVERWKLWQVQKPRVKADAYEEYGRRTCRQFQRYEVPFAPYNLRHAYAIRASVVFKFPVATAAAYMGHAPTVHWNLYNRWISDEQHAQEFERQMNRSDRPMAPSSASDALDVR
ncbi:MAG: hypothetical protein WBA57_14390 [Elainellaceae cyanobacterium]